MRVTYIPGASLTVLQSTAGTFDGTYCERAVATLGGIKLTAAAPGVDLNGLVVRSYASGQAELFSGENRLSRLDTGGVLTLAALAARINATREFRAYVRASVVTPGAMVSTSVALAGGLDATIESEGARYRFAAAGNAGLFYFDQDRALILESIEGNFPAGVGAALKVELVNLDDGLSPITNESSTLYASVVPATADFSMTDVGTVLQKFRALRVTCPAAGKVWVTFRQAPASP